MRVFLDTNVLVRAFATRGLCTDVLRVILAEHELVLGSAVLAELMRVLETNLGLPPKTLKEAEAFLRREAILVMDSVPLRIRIRDRADVPILSEAVAGNAAVLVTGDRDLLDIAAEAPVSILSPRAFWERLRSDPDGPR
jgi:putative PIN family toxin of toxin-antitoxin system